MPLAVTPLLDLPLHKFTHSSLLATVATCCSFPPEPSPKVYPVGAVENQIQTFWIHFKLKKMVNAERKMCIEKHVTFDKSHVLPC